jgi:hypothetical protein
MYLLASNVKNKLQLVIGHVSWSGRELGIRLDNFVDRLQEVLLRGHFPPGPDGKHARLGAHATDLRARRVGAQPRQQFESDVALDAHGPRVDLEDVRAPLQVGQPELHLPVETAGPHQGGVESVGPVGRHQHLDVAAGVEPVQLVNQLQHGALHLVVAAGAVVETRPADGIDLVEKDQTGLLGARHLEQLADHAGPLAHVLLHQLGADHADEARVRAVGHSTCAQGLARARGAEQEDALGGLDSQLHEFLRLKSITDDAYDSR